MAEPAAAALARPPGLVVPRAALALAAVAALAVAATLASLALGAVAIPPERVLRVLWAGLSEGSGAAREPGLAREALIVLNIRLPRTIVGLLVGAGLAVSGALMQGLFRNPLADPGLIGVSAGAALAAATVIVLGDAILPAGRLPFAVLPVGAFLGALASTFALYGIATRQGRTSIATMLLAGIALAALAGAGTGLLAYLSDDRQLRDLTFWTLGSLGGATWTKLAVVAPAILPVLVAVPFLGRSLNALVLGEAEAFHLGVDVQRVKRLAVVLVAVAVGAGVATAGVIGFVGIVVPHLVRLVVGPAHRLLLPASGLLGGALLVAADVLARLVAAPAELPIGILTAGIGAPFFLWLLLRRDAGLDG